MTDRKMVINGLESQLDDLQKYADADEVLTLTQDQAKGILSLLKEQEARVMTLDELTEIYVEFKGGNCPIRLTNFDLQEIIMYTVDGDCRLWTGKPTDEQRMTVKWE